MLSLFRSSDNLGRPQSNRFSRHVNEKTSPQLTTSVLTVYNEHVVKAVLWGWVFDVTTLVTDMRRTERGAPKWEIPGLEHAAWWSLLKLSLGQPFIFKSLIPTHSYVLKSFRYLKKHQGSEMYVDTTKAARSHASFVLLCFVSSHGPRSITGINFNPGMDD